MALADTPVVMLVGARQAGKTTLAQELLGDSARNDSVTYYTLDDFDTLAAAKGDPKGFIAGASVAGTVILDEIQRAPELLPAIKASVDRDRRPGRFLITGSANVLTLPKVSESLAGRVEILTLWPLAQSELSEAPTEGTNFVDALFSNESLVSLFQPLIPDTRRLIPNTLFSRILDGGYPEPLTRSESRREDWFASYLTTILQRDVRDLANLEGLTQMPRLLTLLAARTAGSLNVSDISRTIDIPFTTLQRYLALLETIYLTYSLPAWAANIGTRMIKSPKILLTDTGLAGYLLGASEERASRDPTLRGSLLETFAAMEILKESGWSVTRPALYHWRTARREEVDLLLETRDGRIVGLEIKATASPKSDDFNGLRALRNAVGDRFHRGVVLHTGTGITPFSPELVALPVDALWRA